MIVMSEKSSLEVESPRPGADWIDTATAAERLRVCQRRIRQLCGEKWEPVGLARQVPNADGKPKWLISREADPKFARILWPEQIELNPSESTEKQREVALYRKTILDGWERATAYAPNRAKATAKYRSELKDATGKTVSQKTLYNWRHLFRAKGLPGLIDKRSDGENCVLGRDDPFLADFARRWLNPQRPSVSRCIEASEIAARHHGWTIHARKTCDRFIKSIPIATILLMRGGKSAMTKGGEPYLERDYTGLESNDIFCGDHHECDVFVRVGDRHMRPWLTVWEDLRSRKIVGWCIYAGDPNTDRILSAFGNAVMEFGVPKSVLIDNGLDFDSYALQGITKLDRRRVKVRLNPKWMQGVFTGLGVRVQHAQPYRPQSKPVERFFRTVEDTFGRSWLTYCGGKPEDRPENLFDNLKRGLAPTLEEFRDGFIQWLAGYHAKPHVGQGMDLQSPDQVYARCLVSKTTAPAAMLEMLLQEPTRPVKVGRNGVTYHGIRYGQFDLGKYLGREVQLRINHADLSKVSVFDMDGKLICVAPANQKVPFGADKELLREVLAKKRRRARIDKEYWQVKPQLHDDVITGMFDAAAERRKQSEQPHDPPPAPSIRPLQSPLADQMPALQRALKQAELRPAAGAETLTFAQVGAAMAEIAAANESNADAGDPFQELVRLSQKGAL